MYFGRTKQHGYRTVATKFSTDAPATSLCGPFRTREKSTQAYATAPASSVDTTNRTNRVSATTNTWKPSNKVECDIAVSGSGIYKSKAMEKS